MLTQEEKTSNCLYFYKLENNNCTNQPSNTNPLNINNTRHTVYGMMMRNQKSGIHWNTEFTPKSRKPPPSLSPPPEE